jgi:predicted ATP-grasp superfamily ATP-dependent carboligase
MGDHVATAIVGSLVSGLAMGGVTVVALRVHVQYLRQMVEQLRQRVESIDKRLQSTREAVLTKLEDQ